MCVVRFYVCCVCCCCCCAGGSFLLVCHCCFCVFVVFVLCVLLLYAVVVRVSSFVCVPLVLSATFHSCVCVYYCIGEIVSVCCCCMFVFFVVAVVFALVVYVLSLCCCCCFVPLFVASCFVMLLFYKLFVDVLRVVDFCSSVLRGWVGVFVLCFCPRACYVCVCLCMCSCAVTVVGGVCVRCLLRSVHAVVVFVFFFSWGGVVVVFVVL